VEGRLINHLDRTVRRQQRKQPRRRRALAAGRLPSKHH